MRFSILGRALLSTLVLLTPAAGFAMLQLAGNSDEPPKAEFDNQVLNDPVTQLQRMVDNGEVKLDFDSDHGYLQSVLNALKVPASSQMLVFSKTSLQMALINPKNPRALYFNDDVYIGWIPGAPVLEAISLDPKAGPVFYTLKQEKNDHPKFKRENANCSSCHGGSTTAQLLMLSVFTDPLGNNYGTASGIGLGPLGKMWGGWYVTGTHGDQEHLGNITPIPEAFTGSLANPVSRIKLGTGENVTDLSSRLDIQRYLHQDSDIVALMVHRDQIAIHNLITSASFRVRVLIEREQLANGGTGNDSKPVSANTMAQIEDEAEPLVRAMLSAGSPRLFEPIAGTSHFAAEFSRQGPRDSQGRSLRDLDLEHRLFRYPLSYLIYSESFSEMPSVLKQFVYKRIWEVLSGADQSRDFAHLSKTDRAAILGILEETKPDFVALAGKSGN